MRIAIEAGPRINEALAGWADWAQEADLMSAEDFGKGAATKDEVAAEDPGGSPSR
jgi:hypothetical protein